MLIESRQFALALVTGATAFETLATVPPGVRWILKDVRFRPYLAAPGNQFALAVETAGGVFAPVYDTALEAVAPHWTGWSVLEAGDKLRAYALTGDYLRVLASGTELSDL